MSRPGDRQTSRGHPGSPQGSPTLSDFPLNKQKALLALLITPSIEGAAQTAELSSKTIRRYLRDQDFAARLKAERQTAFQVAAGALQGLLSQAVQTLADVIGDESAAPSVRVRAANSVLDHARAWYEIDEIERRVDEIEIVLEWDK